MGNKTGIRLDYKQDNIDRVMDRAKAESEFSDKLYDLMFEYQERLGSMKSKIWREPLSESERVGDLNLPLSRLYNLIWSAALSLNDKGKSKKKERVIA